MSLTWDSTADIDLKIYDLGGRRAGLVNGTLVNEFPGATFSGNDTDGFGPETFDDPSGRRVGYLVCYVSGPRANVTLIDSGRQGRSLYGHARAGRIPVRSQTPTPPPSAGDTCRSALTAERAGSPRGFAIMGAWRHPPRPRSSSAA